LYYRLKVVEIPLPPLRERLGDIPLLVDHFCKLFNRRFNKNIEGVSADVLRIFSNYTWPGNIRELEHAIEHAFVLCHNRFIAVEHLPPESRELQGDQRATAHKKSSFNLKTILETLEKTGGNKSRAARMLGINRRTIYRKLSRYEESD